MTPHSSLRMLFVLSASSVVLAFGGCASKEERIARRRWETQDERTSREVFKKDWLLPSVSEDEKEFFYRSWLRSE